MRRTQSIVEGGKLNSLNQNSGSAWVLEENQYVSKEILKVLVRNNFTVINREIEFFKDALQEYHKSRLPNKAGKSEE